MKITYALRFLFVFALLLASCSSDDDATPNDDDNDDQNFFPLVVGNSWDFENTLSTAGQDDLVTNETLSISGTSENSGNVVYEVETDDPANSGPVTLALSQGTLTKSNAKLIYTGVFGLGLEGFPEVNFDVENAPIYDKSASNGIEMYSQIGTIEQDFQGVPITIEYTLSTIMGESLASFDVNGTTYDNVISSQLIINMVASASVDPLPPFPILASQDAVIITNYFADGVGLIQSETVTTFVFQDLPIPNIPLEDISLTTLQILTDYSVTLE